MATLAGQIKTGSLVGNYNQLLRIEEALQGKAPYSTESLLKRHCYSR
ncbi:hypothetical protein GCM10017624_13890 [Azotobacter vinelandii]|nr:hypothetical protein GCM10017624_13890 [Azotobacter vinelandii]SFY10099.1 Enolase, C-terminal TIM barrel domain [Azotobacter vinelandii]